MKKSSYETIASGASDAVPKVAIVYVTDSNFALPSAASAIAVREQVGASVADIIVVTVSIDKTIVSLLSDALERYKITVIPLENQAFTKFDQQRYHKSHVPIAALARFFFLDVLPHKYDRILYLDGDVWPCGELTTLLQLQLPPSTLAAAEDMSYFYKRDFGPSGDSARKYFRAIGVEPSNGYFNSGVLLTDYDTWHMLCEKAFQYFVENVERCRHYDQSALNAVASGYRVRLSPKWNFQSAYLTWGIAPLSNAKLLHFSGGFKPWTAPSRHYPGMYETYQRYFKLLAHTNLEVKSLSVEAARIEEDSITRSRLKMKTVFRYRSLLRRRQYQRLDGLGTV